MLYQNTKGEACLAFGLALRERPAAAANSTFSLLVAHIISVVRSVFRDLTGSVVLLFLFLF